MSACLLLRQMGSKGVAVSDVIVRFPVHPGQEAQLFGTYLSQFMERLARKAELWAGDDAPCLMVRTDPLQDFELKVLTFQKAGAAKAFTNGWARARSGLAAG